MKEIKAAELRGRSDDDLLAMVDEKQKALFTFRVKNTTKELEDGSTLKATRREIARVKGVLRERGILI